MVIPSYLNKPLKRCRLLPLTEHPGPVHLQQYNKGHEIRYLKTLTFLFILHAFVLAAAGFVPVLSDQGLCSQTDNIDKPPDITPPFDGPFKYPFTKKGSVECGRWRSGSQDYPYFGAPRDGNARKHAGIDLYPAGGEGTPVRSMRDGRVVRIAPFYTRRNGEITYAVLVDHN